MAKIWVYDAETYGVVAEIEGERMKTYQVAEERWDMEQYAYTSSPAFGYNDGLDECEMSKDVEDFGGVKIRLCREV